MDSALLSSRDGYPLEPKSGLNGVKPPVEFGVNFPLRVPWPLSTAVPRDLPLPITRDNPPHCVGVGLFILGVLLTSCSSVFWECQFLDGGRKKVGAGGGLAASGSILAVSTHSSSQPSSWMERRWAGPSYLESERHPRLCLCIYAF